jgi:putative NIF3 family GTP cyclohydrolase 1 type 2
MSHLSRREFVALAASSAAASVVWPTGLRAASALTAQDVIDRVKARLGVPWKAETVDTIKAGDPAATVTGIATTGMATLDVLQRASRMGANLIVTLDPTFFSRADGRTPPRGRGRAEGPPVADTVFDGKREFIDAHGLIVWRLSDHWRLRAPDPLLEGLTGAFNWAPYRDAGDPSRFRLPSRSLKDLALEVKKSLGARGGIRIVGDPGTTVRTVGLLPGSTPIQAALQVMPSVDAIIAGEVREWETVVYAQDVVASGQKKGLILTGRLVSEEPSMKVCAAWLSTLVPEVRTTWLTAGDPYWRPR